MSVARFTITIALSILISVPSSAQDLTPLRYFADGTGRDGSRNPLSGHISWQASRDGNHLWVAARSQGIYTVTLLENVGGESPLRISAVFDPFPNGNREIRSIRLSPDGDNLYVMSGDLLFVLRADPAVPELVPVQVLEYHIRDLAFSPGGQFAYASFFSGQPIHAFRRDVNTGRLTFVNAAAFTTSTHQRVWVHPGSGTVIAKADVGENAPDYNHVYLTFETDQETGALLSERQAVAALDGLVPSVLPGMIAANSLFNGTTYYSIFGLYTEDEGTITSTGSGFPGVSGMRISSFVPSADGLFWYAVELNTGIVTIVEAEPDGSSLSFVEHNSDGAWSIRHLLPSGDNRYLYGAMTPESKIAVFERDEATGSLQLKNTIKGLDRVVWGMSGIASTDFGDVDTRLFSATTNGDVGLFVRDGAGTPFEFRHSLRFDGAAHFDVRRADLAVSPDGRDVYALFSGIQGDALAHFSVDPSTLQLNLVNALTTDDLSFGADRAALGPDGEYLYTGGDTHDELTVWTRSLDTGELAFSRSVETGPILDIEVDPDNVRMFVSTASSIHSFTLDPQTGEPVPVSTNGTAAKELALTPDGTRLYASKGDGIKLWNVHPTTGALESTDYKLEKRHEQFEIAADGQSLIVFDRFNASIAWAVINPADGHLTLTNTSTYDGSRGFASTPSGDRIILRYEDAVRVFGVDGFPIGTARERPDSGPADGLSIYPSPAAGYVNLTLEESGRHPGTPVVIRVFDILGREVLRDVTPSGTITDGPYRLELPGLSPGVHFIDVELNDRVVRRSFVVRR